MSQAMSDTAKEARDNQVPPTIRAELREYCHGFENIHSVGNDSWAISFTGEFGYAGVKHLNCQGFICGGVYNLDGYTVMYIVEK